MAQMTLTQEEWEERVWKLYQVIENKSKADLHQIREMFNLYNDRFDPQEHATHCSSCNARVHKRMLRYYANELKPKRMKENEANQKGDQSSESETPNTGDHQEVKD